MANDLITVRDEPGASLYYVIYNRNGQVYNAGTPAWESFNTANWTDYDYALGEVATDSGVYVAALAFPAVVAGLYRVDVHARDDTTNSRWDPRVYTLEVAWTGTEILAAGDVISVSGSATAATNMKSTYGTATIAAAVNDAAATTTSFITTLTGSVDDFYNDMILVFTSGALAGQGHPILDYTALTKTVSFDPTKPFTSAPANGSTFILLGKAE